MSSSKCFECQKRISSSLRFYCCKPEEIVCIICSENLCKRCKKKRSNQTISNKNPKNDRNNFISPVKQCNLCHRSSRILNQELFYDKKCHRYYCHRCVYLCFDHLQKLSKKMKEQYNEQIQLQVQLACGCEYIKKQIIQFLSKYCIHCSKDIQKNKIKLKNQLFVNGDCFLRMKRSNQRNMLKSEQKQIYQLLRVLLCYCQSCGNAIDGVDCKIGSSVDGIEVCSICFIRSQQLQQNAISRKRKQMNIISLNTDKKRQRQDDKQRVKCCNCNKWLCPSQGTHLDQDYICSICLPLPKQLIVKQEKSSQFQQFLPHKKDQEQYKSNHNHDQKVNDDYNEKDKKYCKTNSKKQKYNGFSDQKKGYEKTILSVNIDEQNKNKNNQNMYGIQQSTSICLGRPFDKPQNIHQSPEADHLVGNPLKQIGMIKQNQQNSEKILSNNGQNHQQQCSGLNIRMINQDIIMKKFQSDDQFIKPAIYKLKYQQCKQLVERECSKCKIILQQNLLLKISLSKNKDNKQFMRIIIQEYQSQWKQLSEIKQFCLKCYHQMKMKVSKEKIMEKKTSSRLYQSVNKVQKNKPETAQTKQFALGYSRLNIKQGEKNGFGKNDLNDIRVNDRLSIFRASQRQQFCLKCYNRVSQFQFNKATKNCLNCQTKIKQNQKKKAAIIAQKDEICHICTKQVKKLNFNKQKDMCNDCLLKEGTKQQKKCVSCKANFQPSLYWIDKCMNCRYSDRLFNKL